MESRRMTPELEDLPDLIHHIQSFLSYKEATRTSILSKGWLHALSTIPYLQFHQPNFQQPKYPKNDELQKKFEELVSKTLERYDRNNLVIQKLDLYIEIRARELAFLAETWLCLASRNSLKELLLCVSSKSRPFRLPLELFTCKTLRTLRLCELGPKPLYIRYSLDISCHSLTVLDLLRVHIHEHVLNKLLRSTHAIEEITLWNCKGFDRLEVRSLHSLRKIEIIQSPQSLIVEIYDTPSLEILRCTFTCHDKAIIPKNIDSFQRLKKLSLCGLSIEEAVLNRMISKLPFLKELVIGDNISLEQINITCLLLSSLSVLNCNNLIDVKVCAPKLGKFFYRGWTVPSFAFPGISPQELMAELHLHFGNHHDNSTLLKVMEAIKISSKIDIYVQIHSSCIFNIDIEDVRTIKCHSENVQEVTFDHCCFRLEQFSAIMDALLFIFRPKFVTAMPFQSEHLKAGMFLFRELIEERWPSFFSFSERTRYWDYQLEDVEAWLENIGDLLPITSSWRSYEEGLKFLAQADSIRFKLNWCEEL